MTEREKIIVLREFLREAAEEIRRLAGDPDMVSRFELALGETEPAPPRRSHDDRWRQG